MLPGKPGDRRDIFPVGWGRRAKVIVVKPQKPAQKGRKSKQLQQAAVTKEQATIKEQPSNATKSTSDSAPPAVKRAKVAEKRRSSTPTAEEQAAKKAQELQEQAAVSKIARVCEHNKQYVWTSV